MTRERWAEVKRVVERLLETERDQRSAVLAEICDGDDELRAEVESLLRHEDAPFGQI